MLEILLANLVLAIGACIQGVIGYGIALLAAPLLYLINPDYVPIPIILTSTLLCSLLILREWKHVELRSLSWTILGGGLGVILAAMLLMYLSASQFGIVFGTLILIAVVMSLLGKNPRITPFTSSAAGFVSGFMGACTSIGGPPVALLYQSADADTIRANLPAFFLCTCIVAIITFSATGALDYGDVKLFLWMIPGVVTGFLLSTLLKPWLTGKSIRPAILAIAGIAGLLAIVEGLAAVGY